MKFAVLQADNGLRGMENRFLMLEHLIANVKGSEFVVLPEMSTPGYIPTYELWKYQETDGEITKAWAVAMAKKYGFYIGCGYLTYSNGEYYNAYLIANQEGVCGTVYKEEPESNIFKRGKFPHLIKTPLGNIAVGICFDSHRECFYDGIKDEAVNLILMPHAWAMSVHKNGTVKEENRIKVDFLGKTYAESFQVPVVFCNAMGPVERMAGITGALMKHYKLVGQSGAYLPNGEAIHFDQQEFGVCDLDVTKTGRLTKRMVFYETYIDKGSTLFRHFVIPRDIRKGMKAYEKQKHATEQAAKPHV